MSASVRRNLYARRYRRRLSGALEPDERLLTAHRVTFFGSANASRAPRRPGEPVFIARKAAYRNWAADVGGTPLPTAGEDFVVAVTDLRWLVWRTSKWWNLPSDLAGDVPHQLVQEVTLQRVLVSGVLTLRFRDGGQALIEAPLVWRLAPLVSAWNQVAGP